MAERRLAGDSSFPSAKINSLVFKEAGVPSLFFLRYENDYAARRDIMFEQLEVKDVFPTPVWVADLGAGEAESFNQHLKALIYKLTEPRKELAVGGNWQTDPRLHEREDFAPFCKKVKQVGKAALDFLQISYDDFFISGCWANINPKGAHNSSHMHPNNYLAGVYYVALPAEKGTIFFSDPRAQAQTMLPPAKQWNKYIGNEIRLDVKPGRFVLFPAWLVHSVPINPSEEHRISISFNLMLSNYVENISKPLWKKGTA